MVNLLALYCTSDLPANTFIEDSRNLNLLHKYQILTVVSTTCDPHAHIW